MTAKVDAPDRAPLVLVAEIGGTSMRAARFDPDALAVSRASARHTPNFLSHAAAPELLVDRVLDELGALAAEVLAGRPPEVAAVAYPGPLTASGTVLAAPTVLGSAQPQVDLLRACRELWPGARVHLLNDVSAAGYSYAAHGAGDFVILNVGSGIGHKLFLAGQPVVGPNGRGGEIGHLRLDFTDDCPVCDCGGRGHLGALASGRGTLAVLRRRARELPGEYARSVLARHRPEELDTQLLVTAYHAGDPFTVGAVRTAVRFLGQALAALHLDSGVQRFVLVGGFARAMGEQWRCDVVHAAAEAMWDVGCDWARWVELGTDPDSALLGAGLAASARASAGR